MDKPKKVFLYLIIELGHIFTVFCIRQFHSCNNLFSIHYILHYLGFILQILGSRSDMESQIDNETKRKLKEVEDNVRKNKDVAIKSLLDFVVDIQPELHKNYVVGH